MATTPQEPYAGLGVEQDNRAVRHRQQAVDALAAGRALDALVEALLACEARIDELTAYIAQRS